SHYLEFTRFNYLSIMLDLLDLEVNSLILPLVQKVYLSRSNKKWDAPFIEGWFSIVTVAEVDKLVRM
ncbi:hypothetical protein, partial [Chamaesiphon sp. OTE_8_metabat_110]|uniref:hypothetical protein n=1 Tax=Chamaesiphon sp. OTE_8_metabat_110 TaxID=2964696 RepID=UPI00286BB4AA